MHYAAFLDQHETVVAAELDFLRRHLLHYGPGEDRGGPRDDPQQHHRRPCRPATCRAAGTVRKIV